MKRWSWLPALLALSMVAGVVQAAQGDWLARARIININPDASSSALNLNASTETTLELDFTYFLTRSIGLELILATKKHEITSAGTKIGSVALLPPTLTLQYHFAPDSASFRPYVGAGINYTRFYDINLLAGAATVDKSSWGGALQLGVDIPLNKTFFLNIDLKKIWIDTDVKLTATGATAANFKINPLVLGVGVGMKF
ncbi:MAG: OmpW family outer membrane protein [Burkholderiales bacterium]|nr:OmpW family outer membrane protein [Burkholderiales bacterium]MDP2398397.1 OmpW family outer membrane protein [Burkholderiales bacterium]